MRWLGVNALIGALVLGYVLWCPWRPAAAAAEGEAVMAPVSDPILTWVLHNNNDPVFRGGLDQYADMLEAAPGQTVADIGAGTGYLSYFFAHRVAPGGSVFAVDINSQSVAYVRARAEVLGLTNLQSLLSEPTDARLPPSSVDRALLINVLHCVVTKDNERDPIQFRTAVEPFLKSIYLGLKPGGRILTFDFDQGNIGVSRDVAESYFARTGYRQVWVKGTVQQYYLMYERPR